MSTKKTQVSLERRTIQKLQSLLEDQHGLLERLSIHQRNLRLLLEQKANFGITVPLNILNEIELQEKEITSINKQLNQIDIEIAELTRAQQNSSEGPRGPQSSSVNIEGIDYPIDMPYPLLEIRNSVTLDRTIEGTMRYAGGFEIKTVLLPSQEIRYTFYRHGRRISPIIDQIQRRVTVSAGAHITVATVHMNTVRKITIADLDPKDATEGRWTVLSPSEPQENITFIEYPQGYNYYIVTSKLTFYDKHEIWMVYPITKSEQVNDKPIKLWFYIDDWNVAPVIDKQSYTLSFPVLDS